MNLCAFKRYSFIVAVLAICCGAYFTVHAADAPRVVRVGAYQNAPKIFRDTSGAISGVFPDVLAYIAERENWQLEYVFGTFAEGLERVKSGEIDLMVDVAISEERAATFDLSTVPVLNSWGVIIVRTDSDIVAIPDLNGKRIAILSSSVYLDGPQAIDRYIHDFGFTAEFVRVQEYEDAFTLLDRGEVDASVVSRIVALNHMYDHPSLKQTDIFFSPTKLVFALKKGSPDSAYYIGRLDYWVKQLRAGRDGYYRQVLERYKLTGLLAEVGGTPPWVMRTLLSIAGLFLLSILVVAWMRGVMRMLKRRAEEGSRQLSAIFDNASDSLFYVGVEGPGRYRFTRVNPAFLKISGLSAVDVVGKLVTDVIPKSGHKLILSNYEKAIREKVTLRWEEHTRFPAGLKYGEVAVTPIFDEHGRCTALIGAVHDVTENRMVQMRLREQDRVLREAERIGGFGSSIFDLKTQTTEASDAMYALFGLHDPAEKNFQEIIKCIDPAESGKFTEFLSPKAHTVFSVGTIIERTGRIFRHDTGAPRWLVYHGRVEADADGKPTKLIGTLQDITKQKELEQSKNEFISIASHQLRTPVSAIRWVVEALQNSIPDASPKVSTYVKNLGECTDRLLRLTDDLLSFSSYESESVATQPSEVVDSGSLFIGLIEEMHAVASRQHHKVLLDNKNDAPFMVSISRDAVRNVFTNLMTNAIEYSPAGEAITVALEPLDGFLKVSVTSAGESIPPDEQSRLFGRFYRGAVAKRIKPGGSGMGLYIAKRILDRLGGSIGYTPLRHGNLFWFTLPRQHQAGAKE